MYGLAITQCHAGLMWLELAQYHLKCSNICNETRGIYQELLLSFMSTFQFAQASAPEKAKFRIPSTAVWLGLSNGLWCAVRDRKTHTAKTCTFP